MVNEDYLEVGAGGSCYLRGGLCVLDQQWLGALSSSAIGSIPSVLYVSNRWAWTEPRGEVFGLPLAPERWLRARRVVKGARISSFVLERLPSQTRVGRRNLRPVLKHGPRSVTNVRVIGLTKPKGAVKAKAEFQLRGDASRPQPRHFPSTSLRGE